MWDRLQVRGSQCHWACPSKKKKKSSCTQLSERGEKSRVIPLLRFHSTFEAIEWWPLYKRTGISWKNIVWPSFYSILHFPSKKQTWTISAFLQCQRTCQRLAEFFIPQTLRHLLALIPSINPIPSRNLKNMINGEAIHCPHRLPCQHCPTRRQPWIAMSIAITTAMAVILLLILSLAIFKMSSSIINLNLSSCVWFC